MKQVNEKPWRLIKNIAVAAIVFLILEYISGMWLNIYTSDSLNAVSKLTIGNSPIFLIHIIISLVLFSNSLAIIFFAIKHKIKSWILCSVISLISIIISANQGEQFIKYENKSSSFLMAIAFAIAFSAYSYGLIVNKKNLPEIDEDE